jgi:pantoate kinase
MMTAAALCPGHVTGFFEICRSDNLLSTGSRGAGFCLTLGATSEVRVADSARQSIDVSINGRSSDADVTRHALRYLVEKEKLKISVSTSLDLPVSQGFGMSAAGSLSASIALARLLGKSKQKAFEAAHIAEIDRGGGLGDVSALHKGGITVRQKAGLPPVGKVIRIDGEPEIVLCVIGRRMLTKSIVTNPAKAKAINATGARKVEELLRKPSIYRLMELSAQFAQESGLASRRILETMSAASKLGMASMSMLGNSVFAVGDTAGLSRVLSDFGNTYVCRVDTRGPRLL